MRNLGQQTGLPDDVTSAIGDPSFSYGFSNSEKIGANAGFSNDPLASTNRFSSSSFTSDANARVLIGSNPRRNYLLIQNNGTVDIFVGFGVMPTLNASNALILPPNAGISFENGIAPNNDVAVVSSTECLITVIEGSRQ
jgi:hypothetical protein